MKRLTQFSKQEPSLRSIVALEIFPVMHFVQHRSVRLCTSTGVALELVCDGGGGDGKGNGLAWNFAFCCSFSMKLWRSFLSLSEKSAKLGVEVAVSMLLF